MILEALLILTLATLSLLIVLWLLKNVSLFFKTIFISIIYVVLVICVYAILDKLYTFFSVDTSKLLVFIPPVVEELYKAILFYPFINNIKKRNPITKEQKLYIAIAMGLIFSFSEDFVYIESDLFFIRFLCSTPLHVLSSFFIAINPKLTIFTILFHLLYNYFLSINAIILIFILLAILLIVAIIVFINYFTKKKIDYFPTSM